MKKMNNKGFSLVELIIVIAIMAILVAVLAPTYLKFVERSRKSTDCQNVAEIITALQTYAADPMVTSDTLTSGKVVVPKTAAAVAGNANITGNADKALTAAGITTVGLKSAKWHGGNDIELTVTVNADGTVTVVDKNKTSKEDIVAGLYE